MNLIKKLLWKIPTDWIPSQGVVREEEGAKARATVDCVAKVTKADGTVLVYHSRPN